MSTAEHGTRFCSSCSKGVVDFSNFSDDQIKVYFLQHTGDVCGRLTQEQVNTIYQLDNKSDKRVGVSPYLFSTLLSLGIAGNVRSAAPVPMQIEADSSKHSNNDAQKSNTIFGSVMDDKGEPIPFASISIKDVASNTAADFDGKFQLYVPDSLIGKTITVVFSSVGYRRQEMEMFIAPTLPRSMSMSMIMRAQSENANETGVVTMVMGGISGRITYLQKRTVWRTMTSPFRRLARLLR